MTEMQRPSNYWGVMPEKHPSRQCVDSLLASANFDHLRARALEIRKQLQPELGDDILCSIDPSRFAYGSVNIVLELCFSDLVYWVARVPYQDMDDSATTTMLSEVTTMRVVKAHTKVPVPQVFAVEATSDQPFGYPFILMEYPGGRSLPLSEPLWKIPDKYQPKLAKQLANVFAELQNLCFSRIGRLWSGENGQEPLKIIPMDWHPCPGPLDNSLEFFHGLRQDLDKEMLSLHSHDPDLRTAYWILKISLSGAIISDRINGPFPLCHVDLHHGNMLFDEEYNLTAIIDWSNAQAAPLEYLPTSRLFFVSPNANLETIQSTMKFKSLIVKFLREAEKYQLKRPSLDDPQVNVAVEDLTSVSLYLASPQAEITLIHSKSTNPKFRLKTAKRLAKLIYPEVITWEQLRDIYGKVAPVWSKSNGAGDCEDWTTASEYNGPLKWRGSVYSICSSILALLWATSSTALAWLGKRFFRG